MNKLWTIQVTDHPFQSLYTHPPNTLHTDNFCHPLFCQFVQGPSHPSIHPQHQHIYQATGTFTTIHSIPLPIQPSHQNHDFPTWSNVWSEFHWFIHSALPDSDDEGVDQLVHCQVILQTSVATETPRVLVNCHGILKLMVLFHTCKGMKISMVTIIHKKINSFLIFIL